MYTIPWFEEDIQAKTELHAYLSTTGGLKNTALKTNYSFRWLAVCDDSVYKTVDVALICLRVPLRSIAAERSLWPPCVADAEIIFTRRRS